MRRTNDRSRTAPARIGRARKMLLLLALGLGACPDTVAERSHGRAVGAPAEVSVRGLLGAMMFYADTATSRQASGRASAHWTALKEATFRAMRASDAGDLAADDEQLLRDRVVPLFASLSLAQQKAEAFQPWCEPAAAEGDTFRFLLTSASTRRSGSLPARWEGDYSQGYEDFFVGPNRGQNARITGASCDTGTLASGLVRQSVLQALTNLLQMRVILLDTEIRDLTASPASYASWVVTNYLPSDLGSFAASVEPDLQDFARGLAASLDVDRAWTAREATFGALRQVAARAGAEIRRQKGFNPEWAYAGAAFERACTAIVRNQARENVIFTSRHTLGQLCADADRGNRNAPDWQPVYADLRAILDDLGQSVTAYMRKLGDAWSEDGGAETIKRASHHNIAGIAAVLDAQPGCMARMCTLLAEAAADRESARWWQGVIMWGTAIVGVVALVTGVGALALGAAGFVGLAAGLGTASAIIAGIGSVTTLAGAIYLGTVGARELAEAETDLAALLVSGADPRSVQADWEHGASLVQGALIDGVLSVADLAVMVRGLRAAASTRRGVERLEQEIRDAERVAAAGRQSAQQAARAAAAAAERAELVAFADSFRDMPKATRPAVAARLESAADGARLGRSGFSGTNHAVVQQVLDDLEQAALRGEGAISRFHGHCGEIDTLNQALEAAGTRLGRPIGTIEEAREALLGSRIQTAEIWSPGSGKAWRHGTPKAPCESCARLLSSLGVDYH